MNCPNSNLGILLLFLQFQTFFTFTPVLEVSSCNFLTGNILATSHHQH